jgi:thiamine pyrophosphate-dependent acetolactate synthase large subunit-like protein
MNGAEIIAEILKREGTEFLSCYPRNPLIDACAGIGIRPIICRQERVGVGIADGFSRICARGAIGVFAAQSGPGIENAFPGVAQAYADNVPVLVLPTGPSLARPSSRPAFYPADSLATVSKWSARIQRVEDIPHLLRRAYQQLKTGKPGPVVLEVPADLWEAEWRGTIDYAPARRYRSGPDPNDVETACRALLAAEHPVIWAGQGILRADATEELTALAELLGAPVLTTNPGKSAFPEGHALSLGACAVNPPGPLARFLRAADLVFAVGTSLTATPFNPQLPSGARVILATNSEYDINKDYPVEAALLGDARLTLAALRAAVLDATNGAGRASREAVAARVRDAKRDWLASWRKQLDSDETPINPYRLIRDLMHTVDRDNTIITHDAGSPREHLVPFWESTRPRSYIGWGKSTQLGHGLGLIMGAKLAEPAKVCINWMGDAAFCMVGLDLDTAARNHIAILTIVLNNGVMACERDHLKVARERYDAFDVGGNYAAIAEALGVRAWRVQSPGDFVPALKAAIAVTESGQPALIECLTKQCYDFAPG